MNKLFTIICVFLIVVNVVYFIKGIKLSDDINYYEKELETYHSQNIDLEQKIYSVSALEKTASIAAELEYGRYNDPIFVESPQYAYNP